MSYPDDQGNPAGAIPVYIVQSGATLSGGNPLPTSGGSGGGSDITTGTTVIDSNGAGTVPNPITGGNGNLFTLIVDKTAGTVTYYVFGTTTVGSPVGTVYPYTTDIGQVTFAASAKGTALSAGSLSVVQATDQAAVPVISSAASLLANPAAINMAALNATVQWAVTGGQSYYLVLTNSPAATSAWNGKVSFQYSLNGSTWTALNALPLGLATGQVVTSSTANGLWQVQAPSGATVFIRALMSAYTSGTANVLLSPCGVPNAVISMPWVYTVTTANTVVGPLDTTGMSEIDVQISAITTTVLTAQGSNDITGTTWVTLPVQDIALQGSGAATITAASTYRIKLGGFKYFRLQCTTTGTVLTVQGVVAKFGNPIALNGFGDGLFALCNISQFGGTAIVTAGVAGIPSVGGNIAIGTAATANPLGVGGRVLVTLPTNLGTNGVVAAASFTSAGQLIEKQFGSAENDWQVTASVTTTTSAVAAKAAGAANIRNYVTAIQAQNTSATATTLLIQDGASTIWQCNLSASMANPIVINFPTPLRGTAATAMNYNFGTASATVLLNIQGYQSF